MLTKVNFKNDFYFFFKKFDMDQKQTLILLSSINTKFYIQI